jgi:formylglycine-generating enzyme required for sulfatase activity
MFRVVQRRVRMAIKQEPYLGFNAMGDVYLAGAEAPKPAAISTPQPVPVGPVRLSEAAEAWDRTKDIATIAVLEAFIARYKDTFFAELARARVDEVKKEQMAVLVPPIVPAPAPQTKPALAIPPTAPPSRCPACPEMVVVPSGDFTMGSRSYEPRRHSDEDQARVSIAAPFAVGKFAVTFDEWDACVADGGCNGYKPGDQGWGRAKRPVINVNWDDAKAYAEWLSRKTGKTYRLLSEAEREYVTRAGTTTPFWWGSSITPKQANYDGSADPYKAGESKGEYRQRTVPVDSFEANVWGLYNVHGNVWEWTEDCWNDSNSGNPGDGRPRTTGDCSRRVVRGGSWYVDPHNLRSAYRGSRIAVDRNSNIGFRVARTLTP